MATVTDRFETAISVTGAPEYQRNLNAAAGAVNRVADAERGLARTGTGLGSTLAPLTRRVAALAAGYFTLQTATRLYNDVLTATVDSTRRAFEAQVVFSNLGRGEFLTTLNAMAERIQDVTAIDDDLVVSSGRLLAQIGATNEQITRLLPTLANFSRATGKDLIAVTDLVTGALAGSATALNRLGVEFKTTGDRARDFEQILRALDRYSQDAGRRFRGTLPGAVEAAQRSRERLLERVGTRLEPAQRAISESQTRAQDAVRRSVDRGFLGKALDSINDAVRAISGQTAFEFGEDVARRRRGLPRRYGARGEDLLAQQTAGAAGVDQKDKDNWKRTADGIDKMNDALIQQVLGGAGEAARRALNIRAAIAAFRNAT